jgi:hypothetical protein
MNKQFGRKVIGESIDGLCARHNEVLLIVPCFILFYFSSSSSSSAPTFVNADEA